MAQIASSSSRIGSTAWLAERIREVLIVAAGVALALPLILPFA